MNLFSAKKIKLFFLTSLLAMFILAPAAALAQENPAYPKDAQERCDFLQGLLKITQDNPELPAEDSGNLADGLPRFCTVDELIFAVINNILRGAGIFAVIMIMWGGYCYLFSAGNEEQAEKGKKTLMYAILGLVVVIMAFTIVRILATTLTSNPAGSAGGGGSSSSASESSGSGGGAGNVQGVVSAPIPTFVSVQGPFTVLATVRADKEDELKQLCGGDASNCAVSVEVDGQQKAQAVFSRNATQFVANVSVPGPFTPGSTLDVVAKVNGAQISSGSVQVSSSGGGAGDGASGATNINNALSRASFSTYHDTEGSRLVVNLQVSSMDVDIICSSASEETIKLFLNGQEVASQPLTVRQFPINLTGSSLPSVGVSICGHTITGS